MGAYYESPEIDDHLSTSANADDYGTIDHSFKDDRGSNSSTLLEKAHAGDNGEQMTKEEREQAINESLFQASRNNQVVSNCAYTLFNLIERPSHCVLAVQNEEAVFTIIALSRSSLSSAKVLCGAILCRLALEPQCCKSFVKSRPNAPPLLQVRL